MGFRYYSTLRPIAPGTFPKPSDNKVLNIENFDDKTFVDAIGRSAWGYVEYAKVLDHKEAESYELVLP